MKKINFNTNWKFTFQNLIDEFNTFGFDKYSDAAGAAARFYDYSNWQTVDLPHDWAISLQKIALRIILRGLILIPHTTVLWKKDIPISKRFITLVGIESNSLSTPNGKENAFLLSLRAYFVMRSFG